MFKLASSGTFTLLHSFTGGSDGGEPASGLIADSDGNLYGTTGCGGAPGECYIRVGFGVLFKLSPGGTFTVLHAFSGPPSDGARPGGGLIADGRGNLYGTTTVGGASGNGVVFKLAPSGTETVLHSFTGSVGASPLASLVADKGANLYGTTYVGGASNSGVVFKLMSTGFVPGGVER